MGSEGRGWRSCSCRRRPGKGYLGSDLLSKNENDDESLTVKVWYQKNHCLKVRVGYRELMLWLIRMVTCKTFGTISPSEGRGNMKIGRTRHRSKTARKLEAYLLRQGFSGRS